MFRWIIIGVLAIALVGSSLWGFQEREQSQILALSVENNYQRAFHNLAYRVDQLEDHLGTVLAMNTRQQLSPRLAEIWRVTSLAHSNLGQLPLRLMDFSKTEEFLYEVGQFSYKVAIRDLDKEPLTEKEYEIVENLYEYASDVQHEIRKTQSMVLQQDIHWLDVEQELMAQNEPLDNAVINGFHMVNERVKGYSETDWGAGMSQMNVLSEKDLGEHLRKEEKIDEEQAKEIAKKYLDLEGDIAIQVAETGNELTYEAYSLTIDDPDHETNYYMDISMYGGHPVWLLQARDIKEQVISLNEGSEKAKEFFNNNGFKNMQLVDSKQYDNIGIYEFAYLQDNVRVYADSVIVEVALDDGSVIAFEGVDYLLNHKDNREEMEPKLTDDEARAKVHPNVEIHEDHLAVIKNDLGEEVLCYEFYGTINADTYRIFINAEDGKEEKIHKLPEAETVYNFS